MVARYKPDTSGLRELATSPGMQEAVLGAAQAGAAAAQAADPRGRYVASPIRVRSGRKDEARAGAKIVDEGPGSMKREAESHTLNRVAVPVVESGS